MTPRVQFSFLHLLQHHILLLHCLMSITRKERKTASAFRSAALLPKSDYWLHRNDKELDLRMFTKYQRTGAAQPRHPLLAQTEVSGSSSPRTGHN